MSFKALGKGKSRVMEHMSDNTDYIAARGDYIYGKGVYHALFSDYLKA